MAALINGAIFAALLRPLAGAPHFSSVLLTLGIALVLDNFMTYVWGATPLFLDIPFSTASKKFLGAPVTIGQGATVGFAIVVALLLAFALRRTRFGIQMRSVAERPLLASQSGINIVASGIAAWAVAGGILALGGMLYASQNTVSLSAETLAVQALAAAFVGGLDSIPGALVGGLSLGVVEAVVTQWTSGSIGDASVFALLLVFVLLRPAGLIGTLEARRV
jgi:branched-chain amino acid transport system permease protein